MQVRDLQAGGVSRALWKGAPCDVLDYQAGATLIHLDSTHSPADVLWVRSDELESLLEEERQVELDANDEEE